MSGPGPACRAASLSALLALVGCAEERSPSAGAEALAPAARPGLPPAAAGADPGRLQVARWTPDGPRMAALLAGTLSDVDGCLGLDFGEAPVVLVFPYDDGTWDPGAGSLRYDGRAYQLGDRLQVGGGSTAPDAEWFGDRPRRLPPCTGDRVFLVG